LFYSGRDKRYIEIARKVANESKFPRFRHGAVLVKGGSVISTSCNELDSVSWANKFRQHQCGHATRHAELGAILGVAREKTKNSIMYVVRVNPSNDFLLSKPCPMCMQALKHVGVKKVIYSVDNENISCIKLNKELTSEELSYKQGEE
tara:strand:+ start:196 stop:639 length:444 start_codon:yes stop_codon:yes gene_type:complete